MKSRRYARGVLGFFFFRSPLLFNRRLACFLCVFADSLRVFVCAPCVYAYTCPGVFMCVFVSCVFQYTHASICVPVCLLWLTD